MFEADSPKHYKVLSFCGLHEFHLNLVTPRSWPLVNHHWSSCVNHPNFGIQKPPNNSRYPVRFLSSSLDWFWCIWNWNAIANFLSWSLENATAIHTISRLNRSFGLQGWELDQRTKVCQAANPNIDVCLRSNSQLVEGTLFRWQTLPNCCYSRAKFYKPTLSLSLPLEKQIKPASRD